MKARKRNQFASLLAVAVLIALILCLAGGAPGTGAPSVHSQLVNTPAAPGGDEPQRMPEERVTDEMAAWGDDTYAQHAQALRQGGVRVPMADRNGVVTSVSADGIVCEDMLLNPQMDVVDLGGGNWSADPWVVWWPEIYPDNVEYHSASYSLAMKDDPAVDTIAIISPTLDFDGIVQMFMAPSGLMTVTVSYSRLYNGDENVDDEAFYALWTVADEETLDELVAEWAISSTPTGWDDRQGVLDPVTHSTELATLSGEWVAIMFGLWSDRATPYEFVWVDDVQVSMCYRAEQVYLPLIQWTGVAPDVCTPLEPDSATRRGSTFVGATCSGCFSPLDTGDYYTLYLDGTTEVKVCLRNLPSGSNWDALIYWDKGVGADPRYELACQIGTPGDQNKCSDPCTLDPAREYFVMVNTGDAPPNTQCYDLSVEATSSGPSCTPSTRYATRDTTVLQGAPTMNGGSATDMWVGYEHCSGSANGIVRSLVGFNLSDIPAEMPFAQATLSVRLVNYCDIGTRTHTVTTYRITGSWSESSVTWNSQPGNSGAYGSSSVTSGDWGWYTFNVTNLVRGWVDGDFSNHGVMLRGPESSGDTSARLGFYTRETSYDPYLTITCGSAADSGGEALMTEGILPPIEGGATIGDLLEAFSLGHVQDEEDARWVIVSVDP